MTLIGWVPSTKRTNDEGMEECIISLPTSAAPWMAYFFCFSSCILEGSISVLKWHGDIYDGNHLAGTVGETHQRKVPLG
jgi:hypothetical protein